MTNENIPEPIFPSGFTAKEIITPIESLDKLTPEMVDLIKNRDKCILDVYDKNLEFRKEHLKHTRITENNAEITKRIGMGLVFGVIVSVLIYSGVTGDKALTEKVIIGAISGVAGVGGGVLINQQKDK